MKRFSLIFLRIFALFAIFFSQQGELFADRAGIAGQTVSGCSCHAPSPGAATTLSHSLPGSTITLSPGATTSITAYVAHATLPSAGINIAVKDGSGNNAGTFTAGAGLRLANGELTQSSPQSITGTPRRAQFQFQWTAPATPGVYTLRMAGIAVNNNLNEAGDVWNFLTTPITITVPGILVIAPNGNEQWCRGTPQAVRWNAVGVSQVNVEISQDLGQNWAGAAGPMPAASGQWIWNIPPTQMVGGAYLVRVSNAADRNVNDVSNSPFYIQAAPVILSQPTGAPNACPEQKIRFTVGVDNPAYYTFQWRRNGQEINNARAYTYETPPVVAGQHDGTYDVIVTGCSANVVSAPAVVSVRKPPAITVDPADAYVCPGEPATLSINATGDIVKYEWRKGGKLLANTNSATLTFTPVTAKDTGVYEATAIGDCLPVAVSKTAVLGFIPPPRLLSGLHDTAVCEGAVLTLAVDPLDNVGKYEWRRGTTLIPGETKRTYTIPAVNSADAGQYSVTMTNRCGNASNSGATISVVKLPRILAKSADTAVLASDPLTLKVLATGDGVRYQWKFNGTPLPNDTLPVLLLRSVLPADTGLYQCEVSNRCAARVAEIRVGVNGSSGPLLTFGGLPYDFGCVRPGASRNFTFPNIVRNDGGATLTVTGTTITGADSADFSVIAGGGAYQLASGATRTLTVRFSPSSPGPKRAQVQFASNSTSGPVKLLDISGRGCQTCINTERIVFDSIGVGESKDSVVRLCNACDLAFVGQRLDTTTDGQFVLIDHEQIPKTLQPGGCLTMTVRYAPTTRGAASGYVRLVSGAETHLVELVSLRGLLTDVGESPVFTGISVYPNPASGSIVVQAEGAESLRITDCFGRETAFFGRDELAPGSAVWNGRDSKGEECPAGVYFASATLGGVARVAPFVLLR